MDTSLELTQHECAAMLAACSIGRIGFVVDGEPHVLPVNYRWVVHLQRSFIALRTRAGNVIDRAPPNVAFEIDGIDDYHHTGWSVLARGTLHHVAADAATRELLDPHPWLAHDRDSWLVIAVDRMSGRRLAAGEPEWAFHIRGYL
jgi:nitroimidazol reductase NimA-like FMN-containing flavoprotein (pyridoxamine 5'-phosphate oxidase superfamily)